MVKNVLAIIIILIPLIQVLGQPQVAKQDNLVPLTPNSFQFLKYTEMPVSEYTGIPSISVPIYEIKEDGLTMPISLSYHAAGIRVSQEASWVGLGWDLSLGSVVQTINDVDDYGVHYSTGEEYKKIRPDYHQSPIPNEFPHRYAYPASSDGIGWSNPWPVYAPSNAQSFKIATDYYVPVNGNFTVRQEELFSGEYTDSEPDIFRANFLGHSVRFMRDWSSQNGGIIVFTKGYLVAKESDNWRITSPNGEVFYFRESAETLTSSTSETWSGNIPSSEQLSSKTWMLTEIVTQNKKHIFFNYAKTSTYDVYPSLSQKLWYLTFDSNYNGMGSSPKGYITSNNYLPQAGKQYILKTVSYSKEQQLYLSSIDFPKGRVEFLTSARNDLLGGLKLDRIEVKNNGKLIKSFNLDYDYFDAGSVGGNKFEPYNASLFGNRSNLRLKLQSVSENSGPKHTFGYNNTPLPNKGSFAQDLWGFYNGQLSNTSLAPNPTRFNKSALGDNGNNHSASLQHSKAGILEEITYPTKGKVAFDYTLHEFNNYWVPDIGSTTNQLSHGQGLRVSSVRFLDYDGTQVSKTVYSYEGGKAITPLTLFRTYDLKMMIPNPQGLNTGIDIWDYTAHEITANGFFSSSIFGEVNGVGYDKVIKQEVNRMEQPNGRSETVYHNNPDITMNSTIGFSQMSASLPATRQSGLPDNGAVRSITYFDSQGMPIKNVQKEYTVRESEIHYGARIFPYTFYSYRIGAASQTQYVYKAQHLIGYYPIIDFQTLLTKSTETEYFQSGNKIQSTTYNYDSTYGMLIGFSKTGTLDKKTVAFSYPWQSTGNPIHAKLKSSNRLSEPFSEQVKEGYTPTRYTSKTYAEVGDKILTGSVAEFRQDTGDKQEIFYDKYDESTGNLLQLHDQDNLPLSYIWGYNGQYVVAEAQNAAYNEIFNSNFEEDTAWDGNMLLAADRSRTGRASGKIVNGGTSEVVSHSTNWINISLPASKKFRYSAWYYSEGPSAEIFLFMKRAGEAGYFTYVDAIEGREIGKWVLLEKEFEVPADVNQLGIRLDNNGVGTVWFDDVRLYPADAQMTTYTHDPLVGVTSVTDDNGKITFYEYDGLGRLWLVRDQDGNIQKEYQYYLKK